MPSTSILAGIKAHVEARQAAAPGGAETDAPDAAEVETPAAEAPAVETLEAEAASPDAPAVEAASDVPAETEAGLPPADAPQATADAPADDDYAHGVKLAGSDDPKVLATKVTQFNRNASTLGREKAALEAENRELKAKLAAPPAPAAPAPVATAAPAPSAAAPAPPAAAAPDEVLETRVRESMAGDADSREAATVYTGSQQRLAAILSKDEKTGMLVGELPDIVSQMNVLYGQTTEGAAKLRLKPAPEFEQDEIKAELAKLSTQHDALRREQGTLLNNSFTAKQVLKQRRAEFVGRVRSEMAASSEAANADATANEREAEFIRNHESTFDSIATELKLAGKPGEADYEVCRRAFNASLNDIVISQAARLESVKDMRAFLSKYVKSEIEYREGERRRGHAVVGATARAIARPEAPRGANAVALPAKTSISKSDWRGKLKELDRRVRA